MRVAGAVTLGGVIAVAAPTLTAVHPVRRAVTSRVLPRLHGTSPAAHIALAYDDGPDPASTPQFLDLLAEHWTRATFFLLGEHVVREPALVRRMADEGHELGVHGWTHRCAAFIGPRRLAAELNSAKDAIEQAGGIPVRWYRPPYGVSTTPSLLAARNVGLTTLLWTAWGVDWRRGRTAEQVVDAVTRDLRPGGTVLLHDTDRASTPGSWRTTLAASRILLDRFSADGARVGPLADHWPTRGRSDHP